MIYNLSGSTDVGVTLKSLVELSLTRLPCLLLRPWLRRSQGEETSLLQRVLIGAEWRPCDDRICCQVGIKQDWDSCCWMPPTKFEILSFIQKGHICLKQPDGPKCSSKSSYEAKKSWSHYCNTVVFILSIIDFKILLPVYEWVNGEVTNCLCFSSAHCWDLFNFYWKECIYHTSNMVKESLPIVHVQDLLCMNTWKKWRIKAVKSKTNEKHVCASRWKNWLNNWLVIQFTQVISGTFTNF